MGVGVGEEREINWERGSFLRTRTSCCTETPAIGPLSHSHTTLNSRNLKKTKAPLFLSSWVLFIILIFKDIKWTVTLIKVPYVSTHSGYVTGHPNRAMTNMFSHQLSLCAIVSLVKHGIQTGIQVKKSWIFSQIHI